MSGKDIGMSDNTFIANLRKLPERDSCANCKYSVRELEDMYSCWNPKCYTGVPCNRIHRYVNRDVICEYWEKAIMYDLLNEGRE